MSTGKLRIGVIGVGGIGSSKHLPGWASYPNAEIVAISDTNSQRLEQTAARFGVEATYTNWEELVQREDLDVIDIATPNRFHAPMSLAALESGKHVLCEKPMATNAIDAEKMLRASEAADRLLMINHVFRFDNQLEQLRALTQAGELGDIYYIRAHWNRRRRVPASPTFIKKELAAGGPLLDIGVHMLDLSCWFLGFPDVKQVTGTTGRYLAGQSHLGGEWGQWDHDEYDVEDFAAAMVQFEGGATLSLEVSWLLFQEEAETRQLNVFGTQAGLHWPQGILSTERNRVPFDMKLLANEKPDNPFQTAIHRFGDAILEGKPSPIPPEESLLVSKILDQLQAQNQV